VAVTLVVAGTGIVVVAPAATAATGTAVGPRTPLVHSVVTVPVGTTVLGPADGAARLTVDVALRPRDPAALRAFVTAVSTPGSPRYHDYLPAGRLAATFGPTAATLAATRRWLASTGLTVGTTSADGQLVPVTGTTAHVEAVFDDPLVEGRLASGRRARLSTRDPAVPASLAPAVAGVIGLDTQSASTPQLAGLTPAATGSARAAVPSHASAGPQPCAAISGLPGGWTETALASAYGLSTLYAAGRVGAGQTVGLFELEPFTASDVAAFQACYGTHVPVSTVPVHGGSSGGQVGEAALDIEEVAGLAPGASIRVYSGPNDDATGPIDTYTAMVDQDAAHVLSTSWGECELLIDPGEQSEETTLFSEAAAQGQTVLAASGDSGSSDCYNVFDPGLTQLAVDDPADQPDVTGVGGTALLTDGDPPIETAWSPDPGSSGGGNSIDFVAPSWQQVPGARSTDTTYTCGAPPDADQQCREVPDVAASADPRDGDLIYFGGGWQTIGGTSAAAPLWAALVADTDQGCATPAGLLGPALYAPGASTAFNDIIAGDNALFGGIQFVAHSGYDLVTGWGSPRAPQLLGVLSGSAAGCPAVTGLTPSSGDAVGGATVTISGSGFGTGTPTVDFGGVPAQVTGSTPDTVTVVTPDVTYGGTAPVTVTTTAEPAPGRSAVVPAGEFTFLSPRVTAVVPGKGTTAGGARVTVEGTGFTGTTSVTVGSTELGPGHFDVTSPTSLTITVPAGPRGGGSVPISVTGRSGTSPPGTSALYRYALPGYFLTASDGGVFTYGAAGFHGSAGGLPLVDPVVGSAMAPGDGGYWLVASDGGVFAYGSAGFYGSTGGLTLVKPIVAMTPTPDGRGYWLVASDGGVFAFGDAGYFGSLGGQPLNRPIVALAATPDGRGYWLVASDGGVFAYGDAGYFGSTGNLVLNRPVVDMAPTPDGHGYWLVASDGGIFAFGDAGFHGSAGDLTLHRPVVGMATDLTGGGYWLVASDGGLFAYGDAGFYGSAGNLPLTAPVVGMAAT
jgi:hypothetical protein